MVFSVDVTKWDTSVLCNWSFYNTSEISRFCYLDNITAI